MDSVIQAVDRIRSLTGAYIDSGFLQGREAVFSQLALREGEQKAASQIDRSIEADQMTIEEIKKWVQPHRLPNDYLFFLEYYGGLFIETEKYNFAVNGVGPMVEEWYGFLMGDDAYTDPGRDGLIKIGYLAFRFERNGRFPSVLFFIDLASVVQQGSVLGIGPRSEGDPSLFEIIKNFSAHRDLWKIVANSYTEWLELVAKTHGTLGYL